MMKVLLEEKKSNLEKLQLPLLLIHGKLGGITLPAKQREGLGCGSIKWHMDWKLAPTPQSFSFQAEQVHPWEELSCSLHGTLDSAVGPSPRVPPRWPRGCAKTQIQAILLGLWRETFPASLSRAVQDDPSPQLTADGK